MAIQTCASPKAAQELSEGGKVEQFCPNWPISANKQANLHFQRRLTHGLLGAFKPLLAVELCVTFVGYDDDGGFSRSLGYINQIVV